MKYFAISAPVNLTQCLYSFFFFLIVKVGNNKTRELRDVVTTKVLWVWIISDVLEDWNSLSWTACKLCKCLSRTGSWGETWMVEEGREDMVTADRTVMSWYWNFTLTFSYSSEVIDMWYHINSQAAVQLSPLLPSFSHSDSFFRDVLSLK